MREHHPEIWISVSATTRRRRPGEQDGVHYHFVSEDEFDRMAADGELLEWAVVHRHGPLRHPARPGRGALAEGRPALLEIDLQGARQVRERMPEARFVFLKPPSWEELVAGWSVVAPRATPSGSSAWRPLGRSWRPRREFDVTVVNRQIHDAGEELVELLRSGTSPGH